MEITHGVPCIKGEIHSLITLMRLNTRWSTNRASSSSRRGLMLSSSNGNNRDLTLYEEEEPLLQSFRRLNEYLEGLYDLQEVDCVHYLRPFHDVLVSSQANGPLTSAALHALTKFALYGFFNRKYPNIRNAMTLVAHGIAHCVFEETDWESDELILMKILELSALCFHCHASDELTVHSAWEIFSTCVSIHSHYRASKILKSEAETALVHLTLTIFNRAPMVHARMKVMASLLVGSPSNNKQKILADYSEETLLSSTTGVIVMLLKVMRVLADMLDTPKTSAEHLPFILYLINIALEAGGKALNEIDQVVAMLSDDLCRHLLRSSQSEDLAIFSTSLRVIFHLFLYIKDHMKVQLEVFLSSVHLRLLKQNTFTAREELVLESLVDFCREPWVLQDLYLNYDCDVNCSNLFESIVEMLCQRVTLNLSETPGRLSTLHRLSWDGLMAVLYAIIGRDSPITSRTGLFASHSLDGENDVENQVDQWCEKNWEPELSEVVEEDLQEGVDEIVVEEGALPRIQARSPSPYTSHPSMSDCRSILSGDDSSTYSVPQFERSPSHASWVDRENERTGAILEAQVKAAEALRKKKQMKRKLRQIMDLFNQKPLKEDWIRSALEAGILQANPSSSTTTFQPADSVMVIEVANEPSRLIDAVTLAHFLRYTTGLGKAPIGEFISKGPAHLFPFHAHVLREYVETFDFSDESNSAFDKALRLFLSSFRLPGEAQCIDRIMEAFSKHYYSQLGDNRPFASADAAFILSFSTIMLNTDLHNPQIPVNKKMTKEEFIRNNRGINDGKDLPREYLSNLYDEIQNRPIQVDADHVASQQQVDITDPVVWGKLIEKQHHHQQQQQRRRRQSLPSSSSAATDAIASITPPLPPPPSETLMKEATSELVVVTQSSDIAVSTNNEEVPAEEPLHLPNQKRGEKLIISTYETDMFRVVAKPIIETINCLWKESLDDIWLMRLLQGYWQFFAACTHVGFAKTFCRAWKMQVWQACRLMVNSRRRVIKAYTVPARQYILSNRSAYENWRNETGHDLLALAAAHTANLLQTTTKDGGIGSGGLDQGSQSMKSLPKKLFVDIDRVGGNGTGTSTDVLDWSESSLIKGELTWKVFLSLLLPGSSQSLCNVFLDESSWQLIFLFLCWSATRGALPSSLSFLSTAFVLTTEEELKGEKPDSAQKKTTVRIKGQRKRTWTFELSQGFLTFFDDSSSTKTMPVTTASNSQIRRQSLSYGISCKDHPAGTSTGAGASTAGVVGGGGAGNTHQSNENGEQSSGSGGWIAWMGWSSTTPATSTVAPTLVSTTPAVNPAQPPATAGIPSPLRSPTFTSSSLEEGEEEEELPEEETGGYNVNARERLDNTGCPLRPDDALLAAVLDHSDLPNLLFPRPSPVTPVSSTAPPNMLDSRQIAALGSLILHHLLLLSPQLHVSQLKEVFDNLPEQSVTGHPLEEEGEEEERDVVSGTLSIDDILTDLFGANPSTPISKGSEGSMKVAAGGGERSVLALSRQQLEINLLLCFEWLMRLALPDQSTAPTSHRYPHLVYAILHWAIAEEGDLLACHAWTFLERCLFFAFQAMLCCPSSHISHHQHRSYGHGHIADYSFFDLLHPMAHLPREIFSANLSLFSTGAMVVLIRRSSPSLSSSVGPAGSSCLLGANEALSANSWKSLFTLLLLVLRDPTMISSNANPVSVMSMALVSNRIWQVMAYIFTKELFNEENFLPLRALLMEFLARCMQRRRSSEGGGVPAEEVRKELLAVRMFWRMALVACSPYCQQDGDSSKTSTNGSSSAQQGTVSTSHRLASSPSRAPLLPAVNCNRLEEERNKRATVTFPPPPPSLSLHTTAQQSTTTTRTGSNNNPVVNSSPATAAVCKKVEERYEGYITVTILPVVGRDEAQRIWLETASFLADLCWTETLQVIDSALYGLEHLVAAESILSFPPPVLFSLLEELVNRLPLNIVTYTGRLQMTLSHAEIVFVTFRACNLIFHIFVRFSRSVRSMEHYNALFLRTISAFVTNASVSPRTQSIHEEMMSMAMALLRLLRLPLYQTTSLSSGNSGVDSIPKKHEQQQQQQQVVEENILDVASSSNAAANPTPSEEKKAVSQSSSTGFSLWSWFGLAAETPAAVNVSLSLRPSPTTPSAGKEEVEKTITRKEDQEIVLVPQDHDRELLCLAWKTATSLYSLFSGLIKAKDPHLHATLLHCVETVPPIYIETIVGRKTLSMGSDASKQTSNSTSTTAAIAAQRPPRPSASTAPLPSARRFPVRSSVVQIV